VAEALVMKTAHQSDARSLFFDLSLDMLCIANLEGYFIDLNPSWERVLGYSLDELKATPFIEFVHPDDRQKTLREAQLLADEDFHKTLHFENRYRHKDGSYRHMLWTSQSDHKNRRIYALARDVTFERSLRDQLEFLNRTLEQRVIARTTELARSNRDLEQFAYIAAHDLQEPLRTISSFVELLSEESHDRLPQSSQEYIHFVLRAAGRMRNLLDALLAFSRNRTPMPQRTWVSSQEIVDAVLDDLRAQLESSRARIECRDLPKIHADPAQLRQVFQNLLTNALKFHGDQPPHIEIEAVMDSSGAEWHFTFRDWGIGIPEQHRKSVFDLLKRLHSQDTYPGAGIGLAICQRVIEAHGGRIWIGTPTVGTGTTFHFTIPGAST
jgi:PAS domain S-box-containing protein